MTSASADGVPEPAGRRLVAAHALAAHRAGALGGGMLWAGIGLLLVAWFASAVPLSIALSFAGGADGTTAGSVLAAWLTSPHGAMLISVAVLGLVLAIAGACLSVRLLRGAGVARARATTLLGAAIALPLGAAAVTAPLATGLVAPRYVAFSTYGVVEAGTDTAPIVASMLPLAIAAGAVLAVACTAAGVLTWRLAARILAPKR